MKKRHLLLSLLAFLSIAGWGPFFFLSSSSSNTSHEVIGSKAWIDQQTKIIISQADNLDPTVLKLGLTAYLKARKEGMDSKQMLTLIDYSKASSERRLWVIDLKHEKVLFNTWVTHGRNSGQNTVTSVSNDPSSLQTSVGVFVTADTYVGHNGYSLRVRGLERGFNDNAYRRDVVFHGAWYASGNIAKQRGTLGRSWGCMAVDQKTIGPLIETIKDDTVVIAYYPDRKWLRSSTFINGNVA
jgi:hypothetical protein